MDSWTGWTKDIIMNDNQEQNENIQRIGEGDINLDKITLKKNDIPFGLWHALSLKPKENESQEDYLRRIEGEALSKEQKRLIATFRSNLIKSQKNQNQQPQRQTQEEKAQDDESAFEPVKSYDVGALYDFFIEEGVFSGIEGEKTYIEEGMFSECIKKADIKYLKDKASTWNTLRLFLYLLEINFYRDKERTYSDWYLKACDSVGLDSQDMSRFNVARDRRDKLERKMIRKVKK